jgi:hypothetical protein
MEGLRFEDRLDGVSNFFPWRKRIGLVLEENGLLEFVEGKAIPLADPTQLATHLKKDVKTRRIIVDGVKEHNYPISILQEDNLGNVGCPSEAVPV